ncbi:MAG: beta strand repeat-containing protein [Pseudomonadota bacterium]
MSIRTPRTRNGTGNTPPDAWTSPWAPLLALLLFILGSASAEAQSWITSPQANGTVLEDGTIVLSPDLVVSGTAGTPPVLAVTSGSQTVIPNANIVLGAWSEGPPGIFTRTTTISPAANRNTRRDNSNADVVVTFNLVGAADPVRLSSILVPEVNDAPEAVDDTVPNVLEDAPTFTVPVADLTADDNAGPFESGYQTFSLTAVGGAVGGSVALNGANIEFTPSADFNGAAQFTYTITDNGQTNGVLDPLGDTGAVTFTITAVNDEPVFSNLANQTVAEDSGAASVAGFYAGESAGPADESGQVLTLSVSNDNAGLFSAAPAINQGTGELTFTPAGNASGSATVTVTLSDNGGTANGGDDSYTDTFTITVTAVNDAPVAVDDSATVLEDATATTINAVANDTDVENDTLTVTAATDPANGTTSVVAGVLTYAPDANFNGTDTFDYTVSDGNGGTDTGTVTVTVTAVNDEPVAVDDALSSIGEDSGDRIILASSLVSNDSRGGGADEAGQTLTVTAVGNPVGGTVSLSGGNITFSPTLDFNGAASFEYTVSDNGTTNGVANPQTDVGLVTFTITPVNDPPTFTVFPSNIASVLEDSTTGPLAITVTDVEGDPVNIVATTGNQSLFPNANVQVTPQGLSVAYARTISFTTAADQNSDIVNPDFTEFNVTVVDSQGGQTTQTFRVDFVTRVNDAPIFTGGAAQTVAEDAGAQSVPNWATAFQPGPNTATDENSQTLVQYTVTQIAGTLAFTTAPGVANNGTLTYRSAPNANGTATFEVRAIDSGNGTAPNVNTSAPRTLVINVTAVNDAPVASNGSATTNEDTSVAATVVAADVDVGDTLTYQIVSGPTNGTLSGTAPNYTYTPNTNYFGTDSFTFTATDSAMAASNVATFSLTITAVNDAPVGVADTATTAEDAAISVNVLANDTDVDNTPAQLSVASFTQPANGTVAADGALLRYTPNANYFGSDSFTYIVTDGSASSAATTVSLTVTAVNDAPVAVNDAYTLNEDAPLTIAAPGVLGNDTDVDTAAGSLTTVLQNGPATGTLTLAANGGFTYTPNANFKGSDSFTYFVNDGALNSTTPATVTLTVNAVNDPPTITGPANVTILEDQSTSALAVTVGDVETAAGSLVVTATSGNTSVIPNAGIVLGGSGASRTVTVTPAANANGGPVTITLTVTDAGSASTSASFDVTVTPVNDAPGFVVGPNRNEAPGTGLRTVPNWATAISAGPANEALQTVDFEESEASDPANVVTNVEVEANGTLRYVLTGASGMATINLQLRDNGGTANGGIDVSPVATFTIMVEAGADLSTAMVGSFNPIDGLVNYTITITNGGPSAVTGATVVNAIPAGLTGYSWTCTGVSGGACPTNAGSGSINFLVNLPASGSVIIQSQGTYSTTTPPVTIVNTASATSPMGIPDNVPGNNSATVSLTIPLFGNGFEPGSPVVALDTSMPGSWSAAAIDGGALAGAVRGVHPEEAVRFVRGGSTVVLFVRGIDGRTEARLAQRTGKSAAWAADEWQAADAVGLQLQWLSAANGDDVEAAELRKAAR